MSNYKDLKHKNLVDKGTTGTTIATGTTAQRGSGAGQIRFNSTTGLAEYYDGSGFKAIDIAPLVSSINNTNITQTQIDANFDLVITGSNFSSGAVVKFIGNEGTQYTSPTTTVNSDTQITARVNTNIDSTKEPFDVQVTSSSGLASSKEDAFNINSSPIFATASGSLGTINDQVAVSGSTLNASATDPEGASVTHTIQSGALPTGLSLGSANGLITGTPNESSSGAGQTFSFTTRASDGTNILDRAFNIIVRRLDGSTSALAGESAQAIRGLGITTNGVYYLKNANGDTYQAYCDMNVQSGGWELIWNTAGNASVNDDPRSVFAGYGNKNFWTNQTYTVGTHATPYNTVMYKSSGYQYRNDFTKIMIVAHNAGGACTDDFDGSTSTNFGDIGGIWTLNNTYADKSWYQLMNDYGNATTIASFTTQMGALTNSSQTSGTVVSQTRNSTAGVRAIGFPMFDNQLDLVTNLYLKGSSPDSGSYNLDSNGGLYDLNERTPTSYTGTEAAGNSSNRTPDYVMKSDTLFNMARLTGRYGQRSLDLRNLASSSPTNGQDGHQTHGGIGFHHRKANYMLHAHAHFTHGYHSGEFAMGTSENQALDNGNTDFHIGGSPSAPTIGRSRVDFAIFVKN